MSEKKSASRRMPTGETLYEDGSIVFDEFEDGDPRRGPHTVSTQIEAATLARKRGRWHRDRRHVDWLAVRLGAGRGCASPQLDRMFGVDDSTIRGRARRERWVSPMAECDRRELSVLVWFAGWLRLDPGDAQSREALKTASEYRLLQEECAVIWREKKPEGEPLRFTINEEIPNEAYFSNADPKRDERRSVMDELEAKLRELEGEWEREAEEEGLEESAGTEDSSCEASDRVAGLDRGLDESDGSETGVARVGAPEPASS
jgi:hypothetical protein